LLRATGGELSRLYKLFQFGIHAGRTSYKKGFASRMKFGVERLGRS
jgi:hypothetical protein